MVAPTSVVSGWVDEAARFAPGLRVEAVVDTLAKSGRTMGELAEADVVVTTYARPIERRGDTERLVRLRRRIKPLLKRRSKELVAADPPAKQEQTLLVDLHPRHRKLYDTHLQRERQKILGLLDDFDRNRFTILRSGGTPPPRTRRSTVPTASGRRGR